MVVHGQAANCPLQRKPRAHYVSLHAPRSALSQIDQHVHDGNECLDSNEIRLHGPSSHFVRAWAIRQRTKFIKRKEPNGRFPQFRIPLERSAISGNGWAQIKIPGMISKQTARTPRG